MACAKPLTAHSDTIAGTHPIASGIVALQSAVIKRAEKMMRRGSNLSARNPVANWPDP